MSLSCFKLTCKNMKDVSQPQNHISAETKTTVKKNWVTPVVEVIAKAEIESGSTLGGHEGQPTVLFPTFGGHYSS